MQDSRQLDRTWDAVVIGGGPAGSTAATLVARAGRRVLLLDRDEFPRYSIGESLMPAVYWTLERLGLLERMRQSHFPEKHSVQFFGKSGRSGHPFYFAEFDPHESSMSWQVDRAEFDSMLLDNAREAGVEVRLKANVKQVRFSGERAVGVSVELADGSRRELDAPVTIDASGQTALVARQLALKNSDPQLRHAAFFTRYRGAQRDKGRDEGATLILKTHNPKTWFWYIPLPEDQVSVGVVGPIEHLLHGRTGGPQAVYDEEVAACPALQPRIARAEQRMPVKVMRDFSYISKRIAGEGWIMAGDAFGFLDPIYSTGVFLALKSGEFAADAANAAFAADDFSAATLGQNGPAYVAGMEAMRKLVYSYYDEEFSIADFLRRHPQYRENVVDLLIGNVYRKPVDGLFEALGRECALPDSRTLAPLEQAR